MYWIISDRFTIYYSERIDDRDKRYEDKEDASPARVRIDKKYNSIEENA